MRSLFRALCAGAGVLAATLAAAQSYPTRPVRLVMPYPAGQGTDIAARHLAEQLSKALGQNFVVDNRPGAAGNVGAEFVAHAPGDGYKIGRAHV